MAFIPGVSGIIADAAAFSNPFGVPSQGEWNLSRGIYTSKTNRTKTIEFFYELRDPRPTQKTAIDQISDSGGRRLAVYEYPYRDGQNVQDLGRRGETYTFNIKFFGSNYQIKFAEFLNVVVNDRDGGTLLHPVRSSIRGNERFNALSVRFKDYEFIHRYDEWNAVNIRCTFVEDNTDQLLQTNVPKASGDSALRNALQTLSEAQSFIQQRIFEVSALLLLPSAIANAMRQRLNTIVGGVSRLLGQLGVTFSQDSQLQSIFAQSANIQGGVTNLNSGNVSINGGATQSATLPPIYQVGLDPQAQTLINSNIQSFVSANQTTPQKAVFDSNQIRSEIRAAINEGRTNFGNEVYDIEVAYRGLAVSIQEAVESAIASAQNLVTIYIVPNAMSLRKIAFLNGLSPDRQNDIEALNPYLGSVNFVPRGTQVVVPSS